MAENTAGRKIWNYSPDEPIRYNPLFDWPIHPLKVFTWMIRRWISISRFLMFIILGFVIHQHLTPSLQKMQNVTFDWMLLIFLRNTALLFLVAGSLHLYLHVRKAQGDRFKFLKREMATNNKSFKFNDQVYDNMFWSIASGVTVWTGYEVLYLCPWQMNGLALPHLPSILSIRCLDFMLSAYPWSPFLFYSSPSASPFSLQTRSHYTP
jgi:hypothetical protein